MKIPYKLDVYQSFDWRLVWGISRRKRVKQIVHFSILLQNASINI